MANLYNVTKAFTLTEISVVVSIIGIVLGAVAIGNSMIQDSRRMSIIADYKKIDLAVQSFIIKYGGYPGDLNNASTIWPTCDSVATRCNGNSNGLIENSASLLSDESARAWQQLSDSGMVQGSYSGVHLVANDAIFYGASVNARLNYWNPNPGFFRFNNTGFSSAEALNSVVARSAASADFLAAYDAYAVDMKIDDGLPQIGGVRASGTTTCLNGAVYNYASSELCTMQFILQTER